MTVADAPRDGDVRQVGSPGGDLARLDKALRRLVSSGQHLHIVFSRFSAPSLDRRGPLRRQVS